MPNIDILLQALAGLPQVTSPLTPPFVPPNATVPLTTAGQAPVPQYGGPSQVVEPPQAPFDPSIIAQLLATQAPPPQAPAPLGRGQRIANALIGFGAGVQGNLPQFLQQLNEPQREYQRQLRDYYADRSRIKGQAVEIALRQQEAKTRRAQELSDRELEAEVRRETRRLNLSDAREQEMLRDVLLSRRQREDDERAAKLADQKDRAAKETQRNNIYSKLITEDSAPQTIAGEIADAIVHGKPLSKAAEKWRSMKTRKAELQLARLSGAGGGAASAKNVVEIVGPDGQALGRLPYAQVKLNRDTGAPIGFPDGSTIRFPQAAQPQATPTPLPASPYFNLGGESPALSAPTAPPINIKRTTAKAKLRKAGYSNERADAELDRLGIK